MTPNVNLSEEVSRTYLRDLAAGKALMDGERIMVLTPEEARQRFGESESDSIVSLVPKLTPKP